MLAISFAAPLLLVGLLAAGIPFVLHLLSSVRAREVLFPSLRFLKKSMEKTARRRRIQHWFLLLLRSVLLGLLALAVAQPLSEAAGGWLGSQRTTAVILLDNSYSMQARAADQTRFERAKAMARQILTAENAPALAAVSTTAGGHDLQLTADLAAGQDRVDQAEISYGPDGLAQRVARAIDVLAEEPTAGRKAIYLLTDLQENALADLADQRALARAQGVHLIVLDAAAGQPGRNVGITDLAVSGPRVVDAPVQLRVTVTNSSPAARTVTVGLRVDGEPVGSGKLVNLAQAGTDGATATLRFVHRFSQSGPVVGEAYLLAGAGATGPDDDLSADNTRRFALEIRDRAQALIVADETRSANPAHDPALAPELFLSPRQIRWPVVTRKIAPAQLNGATLQGISAAFFCEVPAWSEDQARAVARFVASGGTAVFFLGPRIDPDNYAARFSWPADGEGMLLPALPARPVGQLSDQGAAISASYVDLDHRYLAGLYPRLSDYLPYLLVQRYWQLDPPLNPRRAQAGEESTDRPAEVLIRLANGDPLVAARSYGRGRCVLFTTPASFRWSLLPRSPVFAAMLARIATVADRDQGGRVDFPAGAAVAIRPSAAADGIQTVQVTPPAAGGQIVSLSLVQTDTGPAATFASTGRPGIYRWELAGSGGAAGQSGAVAINPPAAEADLVRIEPERLTRQLQARSAGRVYVADSVEAAHQQAATDAVGRNWWDVLLVAVLLLLVVEAVVSNRRQDSGDTRKAPAGRGN